MSVYDQSGVDNVNPANGNVFLDIPLASFPQRGHQLRLNFRIYYNDKSWYIGNPQNPGNKIVGYWTYSSAWNPSSDQNGPDAGVYLARDQHLDFHGDTQYFDSSYNSDNYSSWTARTTVSSFYAREANGAKHYYADWGASSCNSSNAACPPPDNYNLDLYPANDGSGFVGSAVPISQTSPVQVTGPDGVSYVVNPNNPFEIVSDKMGNAITASSSGWTDSVGRNIPGSSSGPGTATTSDTALGDGVMPNTEPIPGVPGGDTSRCPSSASAVRTWNLPAVGGAVQPYLLCYSVQSFQTAFNLTTLFNSSFYEIQEASGRAEVLSAIVLPDNTSYQFQYDQYLSLTGLVLPTGGQIQYTWQTVPSPSTDVSRPATRALQSRTVIPGHGQPSRTWTYFWNVPITSNSGVPQISPSEWSIVTDPSGADKEYALSNYTIQQVDQYNGCSPHDTSPNRVCNASSSVHLRSDVMTLQQIPSFGAGAGSIAANSVLGHTRVAGVTTSWPAIAGNPTMSTTIAFNPPFGTCTMNQYQAPQEGNPARPYTHTPCYVYTQPITQQSFDYGSGAPGVLLSTISTSYRWQTDQTQSYYDADLLNLVDTTTVTSGTQTDPSQPASGTIVASTAYGYDESGSPSGALGNQTSATRLFSGGSSPTSKMRYNSFGMPTDGYDPKGNHTSYGYDQSGLFVTSITRPPTSTTAHTDAFRSDFNTGKPLAHTDENGNVTTYSYQDPLGNYDPLGRLRGATYPIGSTTYSYNNSPGSLSVTQVRPRFAGDNSPVTVMTSFDNLGEVVQTQSMNDPGGSTSVDTNYDALGRIQSTSTPYQSSSGRHLTTFSYDALGRKTSASLPDGSTQQWCYGGVQTSGQTNCNKNLSTTFGTDLWEDQANGLGINTQTVNDAAQRLVAVIEPPASDSSTKETDYVYSAANDLLKVTQVGNSSEGTRVRTFSYDSLSRLQAATNPESGKVCYGTNSACSNGYDLNGNLVAKTDGRQVVTSYQYDALNRLVGKSYNTSAAANVDPTPASCYAYDILPSQSGNNLGGHLVAEWTEPGTGCDALSAATAPASALTSTIFSSYDGMGRVLQEQQCPAGACSSTVGTMAYSYDFLGNIVSSGNGEGTSGSPGINFTSVFDPAQHLASLMSTWGDPTHPAGLFVADASVQNAYGPNGLLHGLVGVSDPSQPALLTLARSYDVLGRVTDHAYSGSNISSAIQLPGPGSPSNTGISITISPNPMASGVTGMATVVCHSCASGYGEFYIDGNPSGGFSYNPGDVITPTIRPDLSLGSHKFYIVYTDADSTVHTSSNVSFQVTAANSIPTPKLIASISPSQVPSGEMGELDIRLDCATACGEAFGDYYVDGTFAGGFATDANGTAVTYTSTVWPVGDHNVIVNWYGTAAYNAAQGTTTLSVVTPSIPKGTVSATVTPAGGIPQGEYGTIAIHNACGSACGGGQYFVDGNFEGGFYLDGSGNDSDPIYPGLSVGTHTLTVSYFGNPDWGPDSEDFPFTVVDSSALPLPTINAAPATPPVVAQTWSNLQVSLNAPGVTSCGGNGQILVNGTYSDTFYVNADGSISGNNGPYPLLLPEPSGTYTVSVNYFGTTTCRPNSFSISYSVQ